MSLSSKPYDSVESLRECIKTQGQHGNWNYDPYMHGLYNGMELALALKENREPNFKDAPSKWLKDSPQKRYNICG